MIAGIDDDRVIVETFCLQVVEEPLQIVIHSFDATKVLFKISLVGDAGGLFFAEQGRIVVGRKLFRELGKQVGGVRAARVSLADGCPDVRHELVLPSASGERAKGVGHVVECIRFGNGHIRQIGLVTRGILEIVVRGFVLVADEERLASIALVFQPVQCGVSNRVRRMLALVRHDVLRPGLFSLYPEFGIKIISLPGQHLVIVEIRLLFQVPLSDHGRLVTRFPHEDGQRLFVGGDISAKVKHAVVVIVQSRDDVCP